MLLLVKSFFERIWWPVRLRLPPILSTNASGEVIDEMSAGSLFHSLTVLGKKEWNRAGWEALPWWKR